MRSSSLLGWTCVINFLLNFFFYFFSFMGHKLSLFFLLLFSLYSIFILNRGFFVCIDIYQVLLQSYAIFLIILWNNHPLNWSIRKLSHFSLILVRESLRRLMLNCANKNGFLAKLFRLLCSTRLFSLIFRIILYSNKIRNKLGMLSKKVYGW